MQIKYKNFIKYLLLLNKIGKTKKIIKKLIQFNKLKYELVGSILNDHRVLLILMVEYKSKLLGAITLIR
tara:strand:- start:3 stop:209 length:207 start_codon:yes stop_codon:yes gene_type:complete